MRHCKRLLALLLTLAALAALLAVPAAADAPPAKQVVYFRSGADNQVELFRGSLAQSETFKKGSIKSSNTKVLVPLSTTCFTYCSQNLNGKSKLEMRDFTVTMRAKKPGTAKVSYTLGKKTYTTTVIVKQYQNPIHTLTIPGVNSGKNLASKFRKSINAYTKLKRDGKKGNLAVRASSGWKIVEVSLVNPKAGWTRYYHYGYDGVSKVSVPLSEAIRKNAPFRICFEMRNVKDDENITLYYDFNSKSFPTN